MQIVEFIPALREIIAPWRKTGQSVAFVPTMGNLHAGHLCLVEAAKQLVQRVIVSIFVNPSQFCEGEDYNTYPRTLKEDEQKLLTVGTDLLFTPQVSEVYPMISLTSVQVASVSEDLCGKFRPGHFQCVATVVCKLFNMVQPDVAVFGEKDYQQLTVIRRMVADLNFPITIVGVPTKREASGLAMSSRNAYLTAEEKCQAAVLYKSLQAVKALLKAGDRNYSRMQSEQINFLKTEGFRPDYFAIRREDLGLPEANEKDFVILAAAWLGRARLIDNIQVKT